MQFHDTSTNQGIIQDITHWTGADLNRYTLAERVRNVNRHYIDFVTLIFTVSGAWEFDDIGKTDLPTLTTTLVEGQEDYTLPGSDTTNAYTKQGGVSGGAILKILTVDVLDVNGLWVPVKQIDLSDLKGKQAWDEFLKTDGLPKYYDLRGDSLKLKPNPTATHCTLTSGLRLKIAREPYVFTASDTTREPGFAELFHRYLSYGASLDWVEAKRSGDKALISTLQGRILKMEEQAKKYYGGVRNGDYTKRIRPRRPNCI